MSDIEWFPDATGELTSHIKIEKPFLMVLFEEGEQAKFICPTTVPLDPELIDRFTEPLNYAWADVLERALGAAISDAEDEKRAACRACRSWPSRQDRVEAYNLGMQRPMLVFDHVGKRMTALPTGPARRKLAQLARSTIQLATSGRPSK